MFRMHDYNLLFYYIIPQLNNMVSGGFVKHGSFETIAIIQLDMSCISLVLVNLLIIVPDNLIHKHNNCVFINLS